MIKVLGRASTTLSILTALTVMLGLGCNESELAQLDPDIWVDPEEVSFGSVIIGTVNEFPVTIHNVGSATLTVDSVLMQDGSSPFTVEDFAGTIARAPDLAT